MMRTVLSPAAALVVLFVLGGCAAETGSTAEPTQASAPSTSTSSPASPSETASEASTPTPTEATAVPVYYLGATPYGPRLYREFRDVEGDPLDAALSAAVGRAADGSQVQPQDPDYRSPWPALTAASGDFDGEIITVNLGGDPESALRTRPPEMTQREAQLAIEQLIYTAQGVVQERAPVQLLLHGEHTDQVLGVPTAEPLAEGDPIRTLALVNVTTPQHGATVSDSFVAEGVASSFEATVPWQIRQGKKIVLEGFSTADGWMDKLYPWTTEPIDVSGLAPGEYTFVAMTSDPSGGAEGNGPYRDSKLITVE